MMPRRSNLGLAAMVMAGLVLAADPPRLWPRAWFAVPRPSSVTSPWRRLGRIAGRVPGADNGRPVTRALVRLTAAELPGGRSALTDNSGAFEFTELPTASRHLHRVQSGACRAVVWPAAAAAGRNAAQLAAAGAERVDFGCLWAAARSGPVHDENGDPLPGAAVRAGRYQYGQGTRQLVPAGTAQPTTAANIGYLF